MRLRLSFFSILGGAALALLAGCVSTPKQDPASGPTPTKGEPVPSPSKPASTPSPWQRARVGDRAVYTFSANQTPLRGTDEPPRAVAGRLVLEVVAVQQPWVWLRLSFTDEKGQPLANPWLARDLSLPVNMEASRPLDVPREGAESAEQVSAADRTWEARRYIQDNRISDGPLENRLYAVDPGPLYLTHGLLDASNTLSGFGASGGSQLTLVEVQQGPEGASAVVPPSLERPLGPGTWYDIHMDLPGSEGVHRTCSSAERGYLLRAQGPAPTSGEPCPSFAEAEVIPLEERLLGLISEAVSAAGWPPPAVAPTSRGTFSVQGRGIPALTFEAPETEDGLTRVRYEIYAAAPWDASLAGLAHEARFRALAEGVERLGARGQREPEASTRLVGWGAWVGGVK